MTKANKKLITPDRIKALNIESKIQHALRRESRRGVGGSNQSSSGIGSGGSTGIDSTQFVRKAGDEMSGPLGFQLKLVQISGGVIDINEDPDRQEAGSHSSNIFLSTEGFATTDDLDTIDKAKFQGQLLFLQATLTQTVTLTSAGNIKPFGGSFDLVGDNTILLKWKSTAGKWEQITGGNVGSGGGSSGPEFTDDVFRVKNIIDQTRKIRFNAGGISTGTTRTYLWQNSDGVVALLDGGILQASSNDWLFAGSNMDIGNSSSDRLSIISQIDTDIIPSAIDKDLGSSLLPFQDLFIGKIRFPNFELNPTNFHAIYRDSSDSVSINVPLDTNELRLRFGGLIHWQFNRFRMIGDNIILNNVLALNDNGPIPASDGFIWRDTAQVHIGSGGQDVVLDELARGDLSNLSAVTNINSDLRPQANKDLGTAVNVWQTVYTEALDLSQSFSINDSRLQIYKNSSNMVLNVPTLGDIDFSFQGAIVHNFSSQVYTGKNIILSNSFILNSGGFDPGFNGEFTRNGVDVKVFSGGAIRNLSDIASGGGEFQDNLFKIFNQFDTSRKIRFDAGAIGSGQTRTYIMQNTSGVLAMLDGAIDQISGNDWQFLGSNLDIGNATSDTLSITSRIDTNVVPKNNNAVDLGSSSREWAKVFADEIHPSDRVRAAGTSEIGFLVENATGAIGSEGTVQLPYTNSAPGSDAAADGLFGAFQGAIGFQKSGTGGVIYLRDNVGNWSVATTANVF